MADKDREGFYSISSYGEFNLRQYRGQIFAAKHRDYFIRHTLVNMPDVFVSRLGELSDSTYVDDVMVVFRNIEMIYDEAE